MKRPVLPWLTVQILFLAAGARSAESPALAALQSMAAAGPGAARTGFDGARTRPESSGPLAVSAPPAAQAPRDPGDLEERRRRIEDIHSEPVIEPQWLPAYIDDVPAYRVVEGPTADKEGFLQRLWRVPLSPLIGPIGGMIDVGGQWSAVAGDGGDVLGRVVGAVLGGLFGFFVGIAVGLVGAAVNAGVALRDLASGRL